MSFASGLSEPGMQVANVNHTESVRSQVVLSRRARPSPWGFVQTALIRNEAGPNARSGKSPRMSQT